MNDVKVILRAVMTTGREALIKSGMKVDSCICMVRIAMQVLSSFGYRSQPVSTGFRIWNQKLTQLVKENGGITPTKEQVDAWNAAGAHAVEIDEDGTTEGYPGHLILKAEGGWLADLSIDQAVRPQYDITPENWCMRCPEGFPEEKHSLLFFSDKGARLYYWVQDPLIKDFRLAPDWGISRRDPTVRWLVERMKEEGMRSKPKIKKRRRKPKKRR